MSTSEMNTDNLLVAQSQENQRLDSVNMSDIEAQISTTPQNTTTTPLKGILRTPKFNSPNIKDDAATIMIAKICMTLFILIVMSPIIIADLYFGFTDSSCVNDEPKNLAISMKLYLIVSGFVSMGTLVGFIFNVCCMSPDKDSAVINLCCFASIAILAGIFHIIWNILGAIVFWGTIYGEGNCDKNVSTYIFVSLIIKFVTNLLGIIQNNSEKKK
jgi:hypothetical protein